MSILTPSDSPAAALRGGLPFDRLQAKVLVPAPRPGSISRTALVNRLRAGRSPVVTVVAPAGYGKTTALAQWADRDERPFAWVSVDARDDDPIVLLRHVAAALDGCRPLDPSVLSALRAPGKSIWTSAVPRLASFLASLDSPVVLVLDDAARLRSTESTEVLAVLAQHVPCGSMLAVSGRTAPPVRVARLRAAGRLLEIGPELLALSRREAECLLRESGVALTDEQVAGLLDRTEGWAAGLYLAALAIRDGGELGTFGGDDRYLADYFRSSCLSELSPGQLDFLRRTSILEWMSGPLCDAVLDRADSARELAALEEAGAFLVPLDHQRERFRYHGLLRDLLRAELDVHDPAAAVALHTRAAATLEAAGDADGAIRHAAGARDMDRVARLVATLGPAECDAGRVAAVESRLGLFAEGELERYAAAAATGAWVYALRGREAAAERWLAAAESGAAARPVRAGEPSARPALALVRAALCREGVDRMRADAETATALLPAAGGRRARALLVLGTAQALLDREGAAGETLERAAEEAAVHGATGTRIAALAEHSLLAAARDDCDLAERLALEAHAAAAGAPPQETVFGALAAVVAARALLRSNRWDEARAELVTAERLRSTVTPALPWLAVQVLLGLARARITLGDIDRACSLATEAKTILARRPDLGLLVAQLGDLQAEIDGLQALRAGRESRLTSAELRLVPLLATHLSFREIAAQLYLSRNTIKTHAIAIYRKLGVSSRSDAIAEAIRLGLLAAPSAASPAGLDATSR